MDVVPLRIYLAGPLCFESDGHVRGEGELPSRQARLLLAYLVCERARPASHDALAELLWPGELPASWQTSLKALVSRVRSFVTGIVPRSQGSIDLLARYGCYQLEVPARSWVDVEAARQALDEGEGALRRSAPSAAWGPCNVAISIARRGFLPGEYGTWVEERRRDLERLLLRALDGYAEVVLATAQPALALESAHQSLAVDPLREPTWRTLMRAHAALGDRAAALAAFHRLRERLRDELGVGPSSETEALFTRLLREGDRGEG
jgi:DNA-binding SARP family transcriptional activator